MLVIKSNAKQVRKQLEKEAKDLIKAMQKSMQKWGNATIRYGKKKKPYKRRSGNLDRSQKAKVKGLELRIEIDPSLVTNDGFNYGIAQHDGTKHIKGDPWLDNAVDDKIDLLEKQLLDDIGRILG